MGFLPNNYEQPKTGGKYLKLEKGDTRIRILSEPLLGWVGWVDGSDGKRKPVRVPMDQPGQGGEVKHFWAMTVYTKEGIQLWEVKQGSIIETLVDLINNPDWGDPRGYAITVTKKGDGLDTRYSVMPSAKSELSEEIKEEMKAHPVNLEALFDGGDPFEDNAGGGSPAGGGSVDEDDIPF